LLVIPAIDLKDGRCVRLRQGIMSEETVFSNRPEEMALRWYDQGATRLHLVDLNGAVEGRPVNREAIRKIVQSVPVPVELGGGIRDMETIEAYLALGVHFAILGTVACREPSFVSLACNRFPGQIMLGIDARNDRVAVKGWTEETHLTPVQMAKRFEGIGVVAIVYTDIQRDGMGTGPNIERTGALARATEIPVIASGGISGLEDVRKILTLRKDGVTGMITGRALYDGRLDLAEAIKASGGIDIRALLAEALHMGDEGHNRNKAGSIVYTTRLAPFIARTAPSPDVAADVLKALGDNALSVLNPVMAACKAMADAAHGVEGSTIVTTMARNGTDFGIRVSGLGARWFTAPVATPDGLYFPGFTAEDASGDIGDSTITETAGIGGFAMASAPAIVTFVSGTPKDALNATLEMYEITAAEHKYFTMPPLDFRGTPTGIDIRKVVEKGITPRVNTGIAHKDPGVGQVGAGLVRPPMAMFEEAVVAFAEKYGY